MPTSAAKRVESGTGPAGTMLPSTLVPPTFDCPLCDGQRHRRIATPTGLQWVRCSCTSRILAQTYIKSALTEGETMVPPGTPLLPFAPLVQVHHGRWDKFRRAAWHTLQTRETDGLSHDVVSAARINNIDFGEEGGDSEGLYRSLAHLSQLHVLVLQVTRLTPTHRWVGYTIAHLMDMRQLSNHPTWVFVEVTGSRLLNLFANCEDGVREVLRERFKAADMREWK